MNVAIIGTGAVGGYYGARLAHAGHDVRFLARSEYAHLRQHGLTVTSVDGDFSIPAGELRVYRDVVAMPECDVVCVAVKATANGSVLPIIWPVVKPGGLIVLLQNGFGVEQALAARHRDARVAAGLAFICSFRDGPGVVRHTSHGAITLAPLDGRARASVDELAGVFEAADVKATVMDDIVEARLRKLVWNIPFNGLTTLLGATTAELLESPAARRVATALMKEVQAAAAASGVAIEDEFLDQIWATTETMGDYKPSLRLDYLARRPLEIDAIYRAVIAHAGRRGATMPRTEQLADELEHLQSTYLR
jgi:2-dehydropantoate 2-reductase